MELLNIITSFIEDDNTDFAILIDGSWGSGKTYFLKTAIEPEIIKIDCHVSEKEIKKYELVYISLYGVTSKDELERKLFLEMNPLLKTKAGKITTNLMSKGLSWLGLAISDNDSKSLINIFGGIPKNKVLVFDDLERVSTETINEMLGFINTYTEHQHLKVIIIADQDKIKDKISNYNVIKEKLIRFTYRFEPSLEQVYVSLSVQYSNGDYRKFLADNQSFICNLFIKGEHRNLRTLKFVMDIFSKLYMQLYAVNQIAYKTKSIIAHRFLLFIVTYSMEFKRSANQEMLNSLQKLSVQLMFADLKKNERKYDLKGENIVDFDPSTMSQEDKYCNEFRTRYLQEEYYNFEYYPFLANYIHSGALDTTALNSVCKKANHELGFIQLQPEHIALKKLDNFLSIQDDELNDVIEEVLGYVDEGKYEPGRHTPIFQTILQCSNAKLLKKVVDDQTLLRLKKGVDRAAMNHDLQGEIKVYLSNNYTEDDERVKDLFRYITSVGNLHRKKENKKLVEDLFDLLAPGKSIEFRDAIRDFDNYRFRIFQECFIRPESLLVKFLDLPNKDKFEIVETLYHYNLPKSSLQNMNLEIEFFEKMQLLIVEEIKQHQQRKVSTILLDRLNVVFANNVSSLQNSIKRNNERVVSFRKKQAKDNDSSI